jgi:hypothetical protein
MGKKQSDRGREQGQFKMDGIVWHGKGLYLFHAVPICSCLCLHLLSSFSYISECFFPLQLAQGSRFLQLPKYLYLTAWHHIPENSNINKDYCLL